MRNKRPCHFKDARISLKRAFGQLWKLTVIIGRKIGSDLADLIFLAGNAGRFGEAFEQFGVHLMVLPGFSNLVRYAKVTHSEEL